MSVVKAAVPSSSVVVTSKKALRIVLDTGANEKNMEDLGLSREYQRDAKTRTIEVAVATGLPVKQGETPEATRSLEITGSLVAYGLIESGDGDFRLATICTQVSTTYLVMVGKKVFHFVYDKTNRTARHALESLFTECLNRGPRGYENNNTIVKDFWEKLLTMLMPEGGILEFGLFTRDNLYVPSRLYFTVGAKDQTLSVGGLCYNLTFDKHPRESINKGLNKFTDEQTKMGKGPGGRVTIGELLVPRGNKGKEKRLALEPVVEAKKSWEDLVKVHERTPAEIAGDLRRAKEVAEKKEKRLAAAGKNAKPAPKKAKK